MLTCSRCKKSKAPEKFHRDGSQVSGRRSRCKECAARRSARPGLLKELSQLRAAGLARCGVCKSTKGFEQFHRSSSAASGRQRACKACVAEQGRAQRTRPGIIGELRQLRAAGLARCSECQAEVRLEDMPKDASRWCGVTANCAACRKSRQDAAPAASKRAYTAKYRASPRGKAASRRYYLEHKEEIMERSRRRRARIRDAEVVGTPAENQLWAALVLRDPCAYCGGVSTNIDHVVPLVAAGEHGYTNLVGACGACNKSKGAKTLLNFLLA